MKKSTDLTARCQIQDSHQSDGEYNRDKNENGHDPVWRKEGQTDSDFKYRKTHYTEIGERVICNACQKTKHNPHRQKPKDQFGMQAEAVHDGDVQGPQVTCN